MPNRINGQKFPDKLKIKKVVGTASATGATVSSLAWTKLSSVRVDNVFTASEVLTVTAMVTKTGTNGTCSIQLYWNNTDDLDTPTSLGFFRSSNIEGVTFLFQRRLALSDITGGGNGTMLLNPAVNALNDMMPSASGHGATGRGVLYSSINWTTPGYIVLAGQTAQIQAVVGVADYLTSISLQISN